MSLLYILIAFIVVNLVLYLVGELLVTDAGLKGVIQKVTRVLFIICLVCLLIWVLLLVLPGGEIRIR